MFSRIQTLLRYHIFYIGTFLFSVYWLDWESVSFVLERGGAASRSFQTEPPSPQLSKTKMEGIYRGR